MTKEEILKKARIENSGKDPYEKHVDDICYRPYSDIGIRAIIPIF